MRTVYTRIAGQSLERLSALSDGLFAFAMTLLVLDIRVPPVESIHGEGELWRALLGLAPRVGMYLMSFLTLGIFWLGQQTQIQFLARGDRNLAWLHVAFLAAIALLPFSTALLAQFMIFRVALLVYWINILIIGVMLYLTWSYAVAAGLVKEDATAEISAAVKRRIVVGQALYAFGALLCLVSTYASIAFIMLVQLNYAIAPRIRLLYKL
jgi:uncharacterized membrane protein